MQRELDDLKRQLDQDSGTSHTPEQQPSQELSTQSWLMPQPSLSPAENMLAMLPEPDLTEDNSTPAEPSLLLEDHQSPSPSLTLPRMLDGRQYDARKIDDCFAL